jgi:crossover junction endodeoxyribonuclease RuvC
MTTYLGVDPGASGALALVDEHGGHVATCRLSETLADVAAWLEHRRGLHGIAFATLERVGAFPGQGVSSMFKFGQSAGFLEGLLVALRIPYALVGPSVWQTKMNCRTGGDKNVSKAAAQRLWPHVAITHATADALLIAEYTRRTR